MSFAAGLKSRLCLLRWERSGLGRHHHHGPCPHGRRGERGLKIRARRCSREKESCALWPREKTTTGCGVSSILLRPRPRLTSGMGSVVGAEKCEGDALMERLAREWELSRWTLTVSLVTWIPLQHTSMVCGRPVQVSLGSYMSHVWLFCICFCYAALVCQWHSPELNTIVLEHIPTCSCSHPFVYGACISMSWC